MRKELLIAILIGFGIGLIFTYGVFIARQAVKQQQSITGPTPPPSPQVTDTEPQPTLTIISPLDETVLPQADIDLTGSTTPQATVVVVTETNTAIGLADDQGNFSLPIKLVAGANLITVYSFSTNQAETSLTLSLVHSTAEI